MALVKNDLRIMEKACKECLSTLLVIYFLAFVIVVSATYGH